MSYFYIPQRWTTRRLEQYPRRFRLFWKIKRQQPLTLPKHCSKSPICSLDFKLSLSPPPQAFLCAKVCRTVWGKSPTSTVPHFLPYRLLFQTQLPELGHFSYVYATPFFFTWSKHAGEVSRILSSDGIQSQAKSLPVATGVYHFSLFQVLTMLNFLLNFTRFSSVFRKIPYCSEWCVCTTSVGHEQVHFASFPPKTTHCNTVFFSL